MKRSAITTACLILILSAQTWAQGQSTLSLSQNTPTDKFSAEWRLRLAGTDIHDEQSQSKIIDIRTEIKAKYLLSSSLYLDIQPSLRLQSGQTQSVDGADKPENKIALNQAATHYTPLQSLKLSAGALNQRHMHTSLLMDSIAFPAARAEGSLKTGTFKSALAMESAIPTSTSLSTNTKELEPTPSLNSALLKLKWQPSGKMYFKTSAGYFAYNNLPSAVAQKSRLLGNEINKISEAQYNFLYRYEGLQGSAEVGVPVFESLDVTLGAEYLLNQKAPSDQGTASLVFGRGDIHLSKNTDLQISGSYFSIAPDAAVSYFNAGCFETNRVGYSAESTVAFKKEGFSIGVKYSDAEVMFSNTFQSREKTLLIKLETFYANI